MSTYVGLDWGTSSLRAWKIRERQIIDTRVLPLGVKSIANNSHEKVLVDALEDWLEESTLAIGIGMIGSSLGLHNTKFLELPTSFEHLSQSIIKLPGGLQLSSGKKLPLLIIPGVQKTSTGECDVMRGEESQALSLGIQNGTVLIPGTHSKWITIDNGEITDFKTYLTGELYDLLRRESTLSQALLDFEGEVSGNDQFMLALDVPSEQLTHSIFTIRAAWLMGLSNEDACNFLSGLLIGAEVNNMLNNKEHKEVHIVSNKILTNLYSKALANRGVAVKHHFEANTLNIFLKVIDNLAVKI